MTKRLKELMEPHKALEFKTVQEFLSKIEKIITYLQKINSFLERHRVNCSREEAQAIDSTRGSEEVAIDKTLRTEMPNESTLGHLICLNTGHNGYWKYPEICQYEQHLVMAGVISI